MKFSILQSDLLAGLQKVSGVIPSKSPTPVLENILFELGDGGLDLTGTDLEVSITTRVKPQKVNSKGSLALPARVITEMMRTLPDIPVHFEADDNNRLKITTDQGFYQIGGISRENYPEIPSIRSERRVEVENSRLARMFSKTIFAVSADELRPALMGVFIQIMDNEFRMVATDGHRLSKIVYSPFPFKDSSVRMIVPPKAVQLALKHFGEEGMTRICMDDKSLRFEFDGTTLYTRLVEGQYPDYERVIPRDNDKTLVVDKNTLIASVRRVSLFSSQMNRQIRFSLKPGKLAVLSEDLDIGGAAREELPVEYNAEAMEIGYNAQYLMDLLKQVDTDEVQFSLKTPVNAALVSPPSQEENESFLMLIMPIKMGS